MVEGIRKYRDEGEEEIAKAFQEWCATPETNFDYWFERERRGAKKGMIESVSLYIKRMGEIATGAVPFTLENVYTSRGLEDLRLIIEGLTRQGMARDGAQARAREFLDSDAFNDYPANRISSLMWAVIGQQAATGRRRPPNRGIGPCQRR